MHILFVASIYRPHIGGIEKFIEEMGHHLQSLGHQVSVLTKQYPYNLHKKEKIANIPVYRIRRPITDDDFYRTANELKSLANELKVDVIHLVGIRRPLGVFLPFLRDYWKAPLIVTFAGGDVPNENYPEEWQLWQKSKRYLAPAIEQADKYTVFSQDLAKMAKACMPNLSREEMPVIHAGIDFSLHATVQTHKPDSPYFLTAARLVPFKGLHYAIDAFCSLKEQTYIIHDLRLKIIGNGPEKERLQNLCQEKGIEKYVDFLGTQPLQTVYSYLKSTIALLSPSIEEGGGTINIEASACGAIPIGARTGGIPEYIQDGVTGILFEKENVEDLQEAMSEVLHNLELRKELSQNGQMWARNFSWPVITNKYLEIYKNSQHSSLRKTQNWSTLSSNIQKIIME